MAFPDGSNPKTFGINAFSRRRLRTPLFVVIFPEARFVCRFYPFGRHFLLIRAGKESDWWTPFFLTSGYNPAFFRPDSFVRLFSDLIHLFNVSFLCIALLRSNSSLLPSFRSHSKLDVEIATELDHYYIT